MPFRIEIVMKHLICDKYIKDIQDKVKTVNFPILVKLHYPGEDPIYYKALALESFIRVLSEWQQFAIECTEAETGRRVIRCEVRDFACST